MLYAFTSLDLFCLTFSPTYDQRVDAGSIVLAFDAKRQLFEVRYEGFGKQDRGRFRCEEFEVGRLIDALVLRMQLTRSGPPNREVKQTDLAAAASGIYKLPPGGPGR